MTKTERALKVCADAARAAAPLRLVRDAFDRGLTLTDDECLEVARTTPYSLDHIRRTFARASNQDELERMGLAERRDISPAEFNHQYEQTFSPDTP